MFDSYASIDAYLSAALRGSGLVDTATQYGEPGYRIGTISEPLLPLVVLGDYWCRCDKFGTEDDPHQLHGIERHYPATFKYLESLGVDFQWHDEWVVDHDNDKAYRISPDSYSWQPSAILTEDGLLTPDDDIEDWVAWAGNDHTRCLLSTVVSATDLRDAGFVKFNGQFETGWHPGQNDSPEQQCERIRDMYGDYVTIVCLMDESSQFYSRWSAWYRFDESRCRARDCREVITSPGADEYCPHHTVVVANVADAIDETPLDTPHHEQLSMGEQLAAMLAARGFIGGAR